MIGAFEACVTRSGQLRSLGAFLVVCAIACVVSFGVLQRPARQSAGDRQKRIFGVSSQEPDRMGLPPVMFWAWERPDDLRLLDSKNAGVAFLAGTIFLRSIPPNDEKLPDEGVVLRPRLQRLRVPDGIPLMAVVRIETPQGWSQAAYQPVEQAKPFLWSNLHTEEQRNRVVSLIRGLASVQGIRAIQIDFDATRSEQAFYRSLLQELRRRLPPEMPISITALASWCIGDRWLDQLPPGTINEAVPMLFRMGPDGPNIALFLNNRNEFRVPVCRGSLGLSTDESFSKKLLKAEPSGNADALNRKRIYVFHPHNWAEESVREAMGALSKWHEEASASH
jgi:hypothetical protein